MRADSWAQCYSPAQRVTPNARGKAINLATCHPVSCRNKINMSTENTGVSINVGTPKSAILKGVSLINRTLRGTPIYGNLFLMGSQVMRYLHESKRPTYRVMGFHKCWYPPSTHHPFWKPGSLQYLTILDQLHSAENHRKKHTHSLGFNSFNSIVLATQGMTDSPIMLYHLFFGHVPNPRAAKERGRAAAFTVRLCLAASQVDGRKVEGSGR